MEPLGPPTGGGLLPPPVLARSITAEMPAILAQFPQPPSSTHPGHLPRTVPVVTIRAMAPWRYGCLASALALFLAAGAQVQRVVDGQSRVPLLLAVSVSAWVVTLAMLLAWTFVVTENARRLVAPALSGEPPDPRQAMLTWALPMLVLTAAGGLIVALSWAINTPAENPSSVPLAVAVLSILLAIPLAARPFNYLARVVRQVGGHSADLLHWLWVPVVLAVVGLATIAGLRAGGAVETADQLAPMWVVAVVAIAPCAILLLLAWQAAQSVEEAVTLASDRRVGQTGATTTIARTTATFRPTGQRRGHLSLDLRNEVRQVPGGDALRFTIVVLLAGLALLGVVGAAVMCLFWFDTRDGVILPSQRERATDTLDVLRDAAIVVALVIGVVVAIWSFITVLNVRFASGRRCNPAIAGLSWPLAATAIWLLAERLEREPSVAETVALLLAQAAILYAPFLLIERAADAVNARRTPVRISYIFAVVLLVYTEAMVTLTEATDAVTNDEFGRLAGFLALGAVVLLMSTLAVTEACRSIAASADYEATNHNALVAQRRQIEARPVHQVTTS